VNFYFQLWEMDAVVEHKPVESERRVVWRRFRGNRTAMAALIGFCGIGIAVAVVPLLWSGSPATIDLTRLLQPPDVRHPLGTDELGRDVFLRLFAGGRMSLLVGVSAAIITLCIGGGIGAAAGYYGRMIDAALMRLADVFMAVPALLLLLIVVSVFGSGVWTVCLLLGATGWPPVARLVRGCYVALRNRDFVTASRAMGVRNIQVMLRHILPHLLDTAAVAAVIAAAQAILAESALSFLGLGIQPPAPSWGNMLQNAQVYIFEAPWLAVWPGLMIFLTILCLHLLADGLREAMDVRVEM
jgi:peptide/nickel transport system permease protein